MNRHTVKRNPGSKPCQAFESSPETVLLGGGSRAENRARVLNANFQSSFTRPADLDAFLRGSYKVL